MERFRDVLLDVWREACRHIEIPSSTRVITSLLARHLPLAELHVRRWDAPTQTLQTVAIGRLGPARSSPQEGGLVKTLLTGSQARRFQQWGRRDELLSTTARQQSPEASLWAAGEHEGDRLLGPLRHTEDVAGLLVACASRGEHFQKLHRDMFAALCEPFAAALENDRRLHELAALRDAAEADRRSLLSRLGSQEINEAVVGAETGLRWVMERVNLVAASDVPVLILGETGTGKEVVSRAIHTRSPRAQRPFIRVNCGAIPPELIDSQLFGHERGSFTGAAEMRAGWFERADGGTLFLDEMGELPLPAQVRLLRVLQDGFIERVGGREPLRVDVRIIAATHRDLASMVKLGTFREDLWYRINVFPILLPRLEERREDIPSLARHFAQRAAVRFGLSHVEPTPDDLQLLLNYNWPGNIRELGAVIDRAAILGRGRTLEVAKAMGVQRTAPPPATNEPTFYEVIPDNSYLASSRPHQGPLETLEGAMKSHIERALMITGGRIEGKRGAADLLQINPHTLRARMRKLRIAWEKFRPETP